MKIERINDNQIRCILNKSDLVDRHLKISELAYGSEKAKELFRDMMEQASIDFGFEADDIPLMIEAIPTSRDSIILIITKVEDPEEFEEKFSHYSPNEEDSDELDSADEDSLASDDIIFDQFNDLFDDENAEEETSEDSFIPLSETLQPNKKKKKASKKKSRLTSLMDNTVYSFNDLDEIIEAAHVVGSRYHGKNTLWKDEENHRYYLYMTKNGKLSDYKRVCDTVGEYGKSERITFATKDYFEEHYKVIIRDRALLTLSALYK